MSNIDPRNIKRGACLDCSCELYEFDKESKKTSCAYCGCVPMKHARLEDAVNTLTNTGLSNVKKVEEVTSGHTVDFRDKSVSGGNFAVVSFNNYDYLLENRKIFTVPRNEENDEVRRTTNDNGHALGGESYDGDNFTNFNNHGYLLKGDSAFASVQVQLEETSESISKKLVLSNKVEENNKRSPETHTTPKQSVLYVSDESFNGENCTNLNNCDYLVKDDTAIASVQAQSKRALGSFGKEMVQSKKVEAQTTENPEMHATTEQISMINLVPISFSKELQKGLDNHCISKTEHCAIIRAASKNMKSRDRISKADVSEMAILLLHHHPVLGASTSVGSSELSLETQITKCIKNMDRKHSSPKQSEELKTSFEESCKLMKMEMEKVDRKRNLTLLKTWLNCTRAERKKEASKVSAKDILNKYPALKIASLLLWELGQLLGISVAKLKSNWLSALPKLCTLFIEDEDFLKLNNDGFALELLNILPKLLPNNDKKGKKEEASEKSDKTLLKMYAHDTPIEETIPDAKCEPYLIGIGNDGYLMCYADGVPIFLATASEAVPLLIAAYWVFNMAFPPPLKRYLALFSLILCGERSEQILSKDLRIFATVNTLLKMAGI